MSTAPSTQAAVTYSFVFNGCTIGRATGVLRQQFHLDAAVGAIGETAYIDCAMASHITAAGWSAWDGRAN